MTSKPADSGPLSEPNPQAASWWSSAQRAHVQAMLDHRLQTDFDAGYEDGIKRRKCYAPLARCCADYRRGYMAALTQVSGPDKQQLLESIPQEAK